MKRELTRITLNNLKNLVKGEKIGYMILVNRPKTETTPTKTTYILAKKSEDSSYAYYWTGTPIRQYTPNKSIKKVIIWECKKTAIED